MNEKSKCIKCFNENLNTIKETLEFFSDIKICCVDIHCANCGAKMVGYFEIKKLVEG